MTSLYTLGLIGVSTLAIALLFEYVLRRLKRVISVNGEAHIANQIINLFRLVLYCFLAIIDLGLIGINIWGLLAGAGLLSVILGLALQAPLSNLFAGFFIVLTKIVKKGDRIGIRSIGSSVEFEGVVQSLGFTHARIIGKKGNLNLVPNSLIITWVIEHKPKK